MIQKMIQMFVQLDHNEDLPVVTGGHQVQFSGAAGHQLQTRGTPGLRSCFFLLTERTGVTNDNDNDQA